MLPKELVEPFAKREAMDGLWFECDDAKRHLRSYSENGMFLKHRKEMVENYIEKRRKEVAYHQVSAKESFMDAIGV